MGRVKLVANTEETGAMVEVTVSFLFTFTFGNTLVATKIFSELGRTLCKLSADLLYIAEDLVLFLFGRMSIVIGSTFELFVILNVFLPVGDDVT